MPIRAKRESQAVLACAVVLTGQEQETGPLTHPPREAAWAFQWGSHRADPVGWAGGVT